MPLMCDEQIMMLMAHVHLSAVTRPRVAKHFQSLIVEVAYTHTHDCDTEIQKHVQRKPAFVDFQV